eukprot:SAG31_NODE_28665_length_406_cov_3.198697_1_plen_68_part_10
MCTPRARRQDPTKFSTRPHRFSERYSCNVARRPVEARLTAGHHVLLAIRLAVPGHIRAGVGERSARCT